MENNAHFSSLALGNFDGLHRGHMSVIQNCIEKAGRYGLTAKAVLLQPHPGKVLKGTSPRLLMSDTQRENMLKQNGVHPCCLNFCKVKEMSASDFFYQILLNQCHAKVVCCGFNYRFGKNGSADVEELQLLCRKNGVELCVSSGVYFEGQPISSTRIRNALQDGEMQKVQAMLGRPFCYEWEVIHGNRRGRTMGYPTLNQSFPEDFAVPKYGVYASFTEIDGKKYTSVTNIGIRPTVGGEKLLSETHVVSYNGDLYGKNVKVSLLSFIREEQKFCDFQALSRQIASDTEIAIKIRNEKFGGENFENQ